MNAGRRPARAPTALAAIIPSNPAATGKPGVSASGMPPPSPATINRRLATLSSWYGHLLDADVAMFLGKKSHIVPRAEGGFETGIQKGLMSILGSTKFLYRAEPLPEGAQPGAVFPITDVELASVSEDRVWELFYQNPEFGAYLLRIVMQRVLPRHSVKLISGSRLSR